MTDGWDSIQTGKPERVPTEEMGERLREDEPRPYWVTWEDPALFSASPWDDAEERRARRAEERQDEEMWEDG